MKHYAVVAHEAFKEPSIYFYEGNWTIEELESSTIKQVQEQSSTEYDKDDEIDIYIDYIFESDSPIKWIYQ
jgi:hypothetical protein